MEAQRQDFQIELEQIEQGCQIELEQVGTKVEQLELRSKALENKVKALRSPGQLVRQDLGKVHQQWEKIRRGPKCCNTVGSMHCRSETHMWGCGQIT